VERSDLTARQLYQALRGHPPRPRFGFGEKAAILNVDLQLAFTAVGEFRETAYEGHPRRLDYVNRMTALARERDLPVIWSYCAYMASGEDGGVRARRLATTPHALHLITPGSRRAELDPRLVVDRRRDVLIEKKMPSVFFQTHLAAMLVGHRVDTVIVTGGSTSGCVRATVVDSLSHGYRTIVAEECVADTHEGPHFASLYDMALKYADVLPVEEVVDYLAKQPLGSA
jgi:nicotinamidase-related amidase